MSTCLEPLPSTARDTGRSPADICSPSSSESFPARAMQLPASAPVPTSHLGTTPLYKHQSPLEYYFFKRVSGKGGYATVYTCQHLETGAEYACKVIQCDENEDRVMEALREACMQISVSKHPNVATLKEVWVTGRSHVFLMMENCEGGEVFRAISDRGALPETEAATILRVLLQVVSYCHDRGLIHHDLKPENFMLKVKEKGVRKDNIRAIDFGSTAFADTPSSSPSGTPHYSAPEVLSGKQHDYRADLWSAGVVLYCMLTGLHPFIGDNKAAVKHAVQNQPIDYVEDPWPFVSEDAKDLCKRLLTRDPEERISVKDALSHPWMLHHKLYAQQPHQSSIAARLEAFSQLTPLQRYLMLEYATPCAEDTARHQVAYDLFDWMDMDGDGVISKKDFLSGMADVEEDKDASYFEAIFAALSQNEQGSVSWSEFLAAVIERQQESDVPEVLHNVQSSFEETQSSQQMEHGVDSQNEKPGSDGLAIPSGTSREGIEVVLKAWEDCWPHETASFSSPGEENDGKNKQESEQSIKTNCIHCNYAWMSCDDESSIHGGSPVSESAWDKMRAVRGGSPRSPAGSEAEKCGAKFEELMGSSGRLDSRNSSGPQSNLSSNECFVSGGVTYWYGREGQTSREDIDEDSDSLYGPALADHQARHPDANDL